jgi:hypothetical protein
VTPPSKPDADRGARFMRMLLESDPAHLDVASDEEIERQMDAAGIPGSGVPTAEELIARVEKRALECAPAVAQPASSAPPMKGAAPFRRRPRRVSGVPIAAAAALAAVAVVALMKRAVIVAHLTGEPIGPDPAWTPPVALPTPLQRAASIRAAAFAACDEKGWGACVQKLDEAAALDPAGESDPRVVSARRAVAEATRVDEKEEMPPPEKLK